MTVSHKSKDDQGMVIKFKDLDGDWAILHDGVVVTISKDFKKLKITTRVGTFALVTNFSTFEEYTKLTHGGLTSSLITKSAKSITVKSLVASFYVYEVIPYITAYMVQRVNDVVEYALAEDAKLMEQEEYRIKLEKIRDVVKSKGYSIAPGRIYKMLPESSWEDPELFQSACLRIAAQLREEDIIQEELFLQQQQIIQQQILQQEMW